MKNNFLKVTLVEYLNGNELEEIESIFINVDHIIFFQEGPMGCTHIYVTPFEPFGIEGNIASFFQVSDTINGLVKRLKELD